MCSCRSSWSPGQVALSSWLAITRAWRSRVATRSLRRARLSSVVHRPAVTSTPAKTDSVTIVVSLRERLA